MASQHIFRRPSIQAFIKQYAPHQEVSRETSTYSANDPFSLTDPLVNPPLNSPTEIFPDGTSEPIWTTVPAKSHPDIAPGLVKYTTCFQSVGLSAAATTLILINHRNKYSQRLSRGWEVGRRMTMTYRTWLGLGTGIGFCSILTVLSAWTTTARIVFDMMMMMMMMMSKELWRVYSSIWVEGFIRRRRRRRYRDIPDYSQVHKPCTVMWIIIPYHVITSSTRTYLHCHGRNSLICKLVLISENVVQEGEDGWLGCERFMRGGDA